MYLSQGKLREANRKLINNWELCSEESPARGDLSLHSARDLTLPYPLPYPTYSS